MRRIKNREPVAGKHCYFPAPNIRLIDTKSAASTTATRDP